MGIIVGVAILCVFIMLFKKKENVESKSTIPEVYKTHTLSELILSIDYGRVYPYYIGASFAEVKDSTLRYYTLNDATKLNKALQSHERTTHNALCVSLPNRNPYIDDIILSFNENHVVDSIVIRIKDYENNGTQIRELVCSKFGAHTPSNGRYIAWRDLRYVIRIDEIEGCIEIVYIELGNY